MEGKPPGFGFRPNEEELVGYYLRHKLLGNHSLVDDVIREIKICSLDPSDLRFQSKIKSRDLVWYFFSRRENNNNNKGGKQSRTTPSGSWKLTGDAVLVNDRWGHLSGFRGTIGYKRVLTFSKGTSTTTTTSSRSEWVMHELHYTHSDLPEHKRTSYVICRLEYKGDDVNILSADPTPTMANSASSVVDQSFQGNYNTLSDYDSAHQFNGNYEPSFQGLSEYFNVPTTSEYGLANQSHWFSNVQQQQVPYSGGPYQDDYDLLKQVVEENWSSLIDERTCMRQDSSHHRPKRPVTRVFPDYTSDSDTDSMVGRDDAWSSTDSVGSKDATYHTPKYDTPSLTTVEPHEAQEQPKQLLELPLQLQGKEKVINKQKSECELKMAEDLTKKAPSTSAVKQSWIVLEEMSWRNSRWVHLNNMLVGLLFFIFIIGWIILVG